MDKKLVGSGGTAQPYFVLKVDGQELINGKSMIVKDSLTPAWDELKKVKVPINKEKVEVEVWDHEKIGSDDLIGTCIIDFPFTPGTSYVMKGENCTSETMFHVEAEMVTKEFYCGASNVIFNEDGKKRKRDKFDNVKCYLKIKKGERVFYNSQRKPHKLKDFSVVFGR